MLFDRGARNVAGLIVLVFACLISAWGYIGIFANRWFTILNKRKPNNIK